MSISLTLNNVADLTNTNTAQVTINNNSTAIVNAFDSALDTAGDQMLGTLDMNSHRIINLPAPASQTEPVRLMDLSTSSSTSVSGGSVSSLSGVVSGTASGGGIITTFSGSGNLPVAQLAGGSGASNATFWRGDGTWAGQASLTLTAGNNILVTGTNPAIVSVATSGNYVQLTGTSGTGAVFQIGGTGDPSLYARGQFNWQNSGGTTIMSITTAAKLTVGLVGTTGGSIALAPATGTGTVTVSILGTATSYNINVPLAPPAGAGAVFVSKDATTNTTWSSISTTSSQKFLSVSGGAPIWSTSVWPVDVTTTNQILVCSANHTWSASQTVTNLTLTTPTLTTATMTGTTVLANATMSGNLTFSTGTIGVVGCTDTSSGSAGQIGEFLSTSVSNGSAQSLFGGTASGIMSISLTPGDWDVVFSPAVIDITTTTTVQSIAASINSTNAFNVTPGTFIQFLYPANTQFTASPGQIQAFFCGPLRISIAATATYFGVVQCAFTGSMSAYGLMRARRVR